MITMSQRAKIPDVPRVKLENSYHHQQTYTNTDLSRKTTGYGPDNLAVRWRATLKYYVLIRMLERSSSRGCY